MIDYNATLATTASFSDSQSFTLGAASTYGVGGGTFDVAFGTVQTITSPITGTGGLTKVDGGNLTLAATKTYQGLTLVKAGNLVLSSSPAATSSTSATIGINQYLGYQGLYNSGTLILANGYSGFTLSSNILITGGSSSSSTAPAILSTGNNTINGNIMFTGNGLNRVHRLGGRNVDDQRKYFRRRQAPGFRTGDGNVKYAGSFDGHDRHRLFFGDHRRHYHFQRQQRHLGRRH